MMQARRTVAGSQSEFAPVGPAQGSGLTGHDPVAGHLRCDRVAQSLNRFA